MGAVWNDVADPRLRPVAPHRPGAGVPHHRMLCLAFGRGPRCKTALCPGHERLVDCRCPGKAPTRRFDPNFRPLADDVYAGGLTTQNRHRDFSQTPAVAEVARL